MQKVSVILSKQNWKTIITIIDPECVQRGGDWITWWNKVKGIIQANNYQKAAPSESISVRLLVESWISINAMLDSVCKAKNDVNWSKWAKDVIRIIQQALEKEKSRNQKSDLPNVTNPPLIQNTAVTTETDQLEASSQRSNEWKCPNCDILNPENFSVCRLCKLPNPASKSAEKERVPKSEKNMSKNFYEILGLDINATQDEIKDRFRFLSQAFHPDKFATSTHKAQAEEDFKIINEAYQTLSDTQKRKKYNEELFGSVNPSVQNVETPHSNDDKSGGLGYKHQNISSDAMDCFNQALDLWNKTDEHKRDDTLRNDVAALLMLAINKAGVPFPRAHSFLAIFLEDLRRESEAAHHANIALQQNPNEFRAQIVKIDLSLKGVKVMKVGVKDVVPDLNNGAMGFAFDLVFKGLFMGGTLLHTQATQSSFKDEIVKLIQIYKNVCNENTDGDEYLYMAEMMIAFGDVIKDIPMPGGKPNLFAEIVKTPLDRIYFAGKEQEIKFIRNKAEGRSMLFKP